MDPTTKISALWGTYDAACGGLMGFLDQESTANITNCDIGCVLDVYNDVCGNYQYYQYRYSGMLIGTVGQDTSAELDKIHCENVNVYYDDWVHYFYCEFVKNSLASYTHDYQFSRVPHSEVIFTDSNGNGRSDTQEEAESVSGCTHDHDNRGTEVVNGEELWVEDHRAVYLPFNQLISGYGWGANHEQTLDNVTVSDYAYSITYMDGTDVLFVEYRTTTDAYAITHTAKESGKEFERWVNAGGKEVKSIEAGNPKNVTLYVDWKNEHVVRFLDQHGNLQAEVPFDADTGTLLGNEPPVPAVAGGFTGVWGSYKGNLKGSKNDIVVYPTYNADDGIIKLSPVDADGDGETDYYTVTSVVENDANINIVIPSELNGIPIVEISDNAFAEFDNITTVRIPTSITKLGADAFADKEGIIIHKYEQITFIYEGTYTQWTQISKDGNWDRYVGTGSKIYFVADGTYSEKKGTNGLGASWRDPVAGTYTG